MPGSFRVPCVQFIQDCRLEHTYWRPASDAVSARSQEKVLLFMVETGSMKSPAVSLSGRQILVTGASSGIGRLTARELARRGAQVILLVRDAQRGKRTRDWIRAEVGREASEVVLCNLGDLEQVRRTADELHGRTQRLDVLVNNAGVLQRRRRLSRQGHEWTLAVNHLGPFLLTLSLLDLIPSGGRIINLASVAHTRGLIDFDDMAVGPPVQDLWMLLPSRKLYLYGRCL